MKPYEHCGDPVTITTTNGNAIVTRLTCRRPECPICGPRINDLDDPRIRPRLTRLEGDAGP